MIISPVSSPAAMFFSSSKEQILVIHPLCPFKICNGNPVILYGYESKEFSNLFIFVGSGLRSKSHTLIVLSKPPVANK